MKITHLDHLVLTVKSIEATCAFYTRALGIAGQAIRRTMNPDHMNYECLGNSTPHLHWHIVPRYMHDPRWGQPIWEDWQRNEFNINRVTLTDEAYVEIIHRIRLALENKTDG